MGKQRTVQLRYASSVCDDPSAPGALRFTFAPKGDQQTSEYIVSVQGHGDATQFNWISPPRRESTKAELEKLVRERVTARHQWLDKLGKLVATAKDWADDFGWSTKIVDKKMEDPEVGNYRAPALLLQNLAIRLFLEPVARDAPGTEGIVDLYLMPSYDDIASLYYFNDRWNIHYLFNGTPSVGDVYGAETKPLTKATLRKVLDEMKAHAA